MMNKAELPLVSIVIPCLNEEKYISKCLDSIVCQDYSKDRLEVLAVDGISNDKTREILKDYTRKYSFIKILDNPQKITPVAMNIGIKMARGDYILILSSHSEYEQNFVSKNIENFHKNNADCVGGIEKTLPSGNSIISQAIPLALSHPFGVGNTYYRIGSEMPRYVDTVPLGCYKRGVFDKIGLFNEDLIRNQDIEFNLRLKNAGGKILLVPNITVYYYARANLNGLFKQNFWNGFWVIYSIKYAKMPFSIRHLIPCIFVSSLIGSISFSIFSKYFLYLFILVSGSYFASNLFFSFKISLRKKLKYFIPLSLSFATLHFSYGIGSIWGLRKLVLFRRK